MLGPGLGLPGSSLAEAALPLGGGEAVWLVCGGAGPWKWREVQAGRGQVAAPGSGVGEDVGEARRSDSQDLPCWECQPNFFDSPHLPRAASHPVPGSVVLRSSPGTSPWRRAGIQVSGQAQGPVENTVSQPVPSLNSHAPLGLPVGREWGWEPVPLAAQDSRS